MGIYVEAKKTSLNRRFIDELVVHGNIVTDTFNWTIYLGKPSLKKNIFLLTFVNKRGRGLERASSIKKP